MQDVKKADTEKTRNYPCVLRSIDTGLLVWFVSKHEGTVIKSIPGLPAGRLLLHQNAELEEAWEGPVDLALPEASPIGDAPPYVYPNVMGMPITREEIMDSLWEGYRDSVRCANLCNDDGSTVTGFPDMEAVLRHIDEFGLPPKKS